MRGLGKRLAALAVAGGLIPAAVLAQSEKPLCRTVFQYDSRTTISDILQVDSSQRMSLSRRVTLSPTTISPGRAQVGKDSNSPKLVFDLQFDDLKDLYETISDVKVRAIDFKQTDIFVAALVDGNSGTWSPAWVAVEDSDFSRKGETSRETTLFTAAGSQRLIDKGQTLEVRMANLRGIDDFNKREDAKWELSRYTSLATYDRQAQYAAFYDGQDRVSALIRRASAGECAPYVLKDSCFLTTASCDVIGLADDCWELRTLRRFRDGWLVRQPGGATDIARYYREAPAIAQRLRADPAEAVREYWRFVLPSALAAAVGANRLARRIYTRGMNRLSAG